MNSKVGIITQDLVMPSSRNMLFSTASTMNERRRNGSNG
jgi:hypothetical protein